ncbi:hypothetical protein BH10PSE12_BH10PSE12_13610 [soil metagenome]
MLVTLTIIHQDIQAAISLLEHLVTQSHPDKGAVAHARWKLSRASGARLKFLEESVYPALVAGATGDEEAAIQNLRTENLPIRAESIAHVGKWHIDAIMADWAGYQQASHAMRASMRARIAKEAAILYPILKRI